MKSFSVIAITICIIQQVFTAPGLNFMPQVVPDPNMASYNAFWDGAVGSRGYWGSLPQPPHSVFSHTFDTKGYKSMYELNSMSPFMSERIGDFDKMVPFYSPYSTSKFTYMPTKSNHLTNNELGAYSYDPNEPRYSQLYKAYFKFFNYNLDRMAHLAQNNLPYVDLNNLAREKIRNPHNFDYSMSFDRLPDELTLKSPHYTFMPHKASSRSLKQKKDRKLMKAENTYYNNLFRAETAAALHHEIEKNFSGKKISKGDKMKLLKKLTKSFNSKGKIIKFIDNEFPEGPRYVSKVKKDRKATSMDKKLKKLMGRQNQNVMNMEMPVIPITVPLDNFGLV